MDNLKYTISTDTARVYKMRTDKGFGWANITIREWPRGGSFDAQSDYGSYSYTWSSIGDRTLRKFIMGLDFGYFMGKAKPGYMRFDSRATTDEVRRMILERRREGDLAKSDARDMYDNLYMLEEASSEDSYYANWYDYFGRLCDSYDAPNIAKPDAQSLAFWNDVWPAACAYWRTELEAANDNVPAASTQVDAA